MSYLEDTINLRTGPNCTVAFSSLKAAKGYLYTMKRYVEIVPNDANVTMYNNLKKAIEDYEK